MYLQPRKVAGEVGMFLFSLWKISFLWRDSVLAGTPAKSPTRHASARPDLGELPPRQSEHKEPNRNEFTYTMASKAHAPPHHPLTNNYRLRSCTAKFFQRSNRKEMFAAHPFSHTAQQNIMQTLIRPYLVCEIWGRGGRIRFGSDLNEKLSYQRKR